MVPTVSSALLDRLSVLLADRMGLHFVRERRLDLERGLRYAAPDLGCKDALACARHLLSGAITQAQIEILARHLTIGETYFFRDRPSFESLEQHIVPQLISARSAGERRLRIWSAGCSTGEEAYSIAIALCRCLSDWSGWNISILATDINPHALQKAANGVYTEWSFRDAAPGFKAEFFRQVAPGQFEIAPRIRSLVTFAYLNLVDDAYPALENNTNAMDVIFCRNVLMYFEPAHSLALLQRLRLCLIEGGWLFVSPVEALKVKLPNFVEVRLGDALAYRNERTRVQPAPLTPAPMHVSAPAHALGTDARARARPRTSPLRASPPSSPHAERDVGTGAANARRAQTEGPPAQAEAPVPNATSALYQQGRYAEAADELEDLLRTRPADAHIMGLLSRACANQGQLVEAARWAAQAAGADKLNPQWQYLLATILQEQGEDAEAVATFERAVYLDQHHAMAHFALGNLMRKLGRRKDSQRHLRNALSTVSRYRPQEILPESEGITAGRLAQIIESTIAAEAHR
jgi:chemotaxis protein methyltransferase CheR